MWQYVPKEEESNWRSESHSTVRRGAKSQDCLVSKQGGANSQFFTSLLSFFKGP